MDPYKKCVELKCCLLRDYDRMMCCFYCERKDDCIAAGCLRTCKKIPKPTVTTLVVENDDENE